MRTPESPTLLEVGCQESNGEFSRERQRIEKSDPDDLSVTKVTDRHLEPDARREENAHEPLDQPFELRRVHVPNFVHPAERKPGQERAQQVRRPRVVRRGHHPDQE